MRINQYLVKEKHKMIKFFEQFEKSKRPNIWVVMKDDIFYMEGEISTWKTTFLSCH